MRRGPSSSTTSPRCIISEMKLAGCSRRHRATGAFLSFGLGVASLVSIVACSGGAGTPTDLRGGPDGIPKSSTDAPGAGNEQPGTPSDQPGSSGDNGGSSCLTCSGNYACTSSESSASDIEIVSLVSTSGGCAVSEDGDTSSILACGGAFEEVQDTTTTVLGRWTGGNGGFVVTASGNGVSIVVTCTPTTQSQTSSGSSSSSSSGSSEPLDGG